MILLSACEAGVKKALPAKEAPVIRKKNEKVYYSIYIKAQI